MVKAISLCKLQLCNIAYVMSGVELPQDPLQWTTHHVAQWLKSKDHRDLNEKVVSRLDGPRLLALTKDHASMLSKDETTVGLLLLDVNVLKQGLGILEINRFLFVSINADFFDACAGLDSKRGVQQQPVDQRLNDLAMPSGTAPSPKVLSPRGKPGAAIVVIEPNDNKNDKKPVPPLQRYPTDPSFKNQKDDVLRPEVRNCLIALTALNYKGTQSQMGIDRVTNRSLISNLLKEDHPIISTSIAKTNASITI